MDALHIKASNNTPEVNLNPNGELEFTGRSVPENSRAFYKPILEWLKEYSYIASEQHTKAVFTIEYFNTSSSKCLLDIIRIFDVMHGRGDSVEIIWNCDKNDTDLYEAGIDFESMINCPIDIRRVGNLPW